MIIISYLINRSLTTTLVYKIPEEVWSSKDPFLGGANGEGNFCTVLVARVRLFHGRRRGGVLLDGKARWRDPSSNPVFIRKGVGRREHHDYGVEEEGRTVWCIKDTE